MWFNAEITNFIGRMLWEIIKEEDMYEPMREAIKSLGLEKKTQEARITNLRKELKRIKERENKIIIDLYDEVSKICIYIAGFLKYYN